MSPILICLVSFEEEETGAHREMPGVHVHRETTMQRNREKEVTCKPRRWALGETELAVSRAVRKYISVVEAP